MQHSKESICVSVFFNNVAGLQTCKFINNRLQRRCFPVNIAKFYEQIFL